MRTLHVALFASILSWWAPSAAAQPCMCGHSIDDTDGLDADDALLLMGCDSSSGSCCDDFDLDCDGYVDGCDLELLNCVTNTGRDPAVCCAMHTCGACTTPTGCLRGTQMACEAGGNTFAPGECPDSIEAQECPGATDAGPGGGTDAGGSSGTDAGPMGVPREDEGGCGCRAAGDSAGWWPALLALLVLTRLGRRR